MLQKELEDLRELQATLLEAPCREHGGLGGYEHTDPETCWPCFTRSLYPDRAALIKEIINGNKSLRSPSVGGRFIIDSGEQYE